MSSDSTIPPAPPPNPPPLPPLPPPPPLPPILPANERPLPSEDTEKKKALLVYQSYQHSITDDDDEDEDEDEVEDEEVEADTKVMEEELEGASWGREKEEAHILLSPKNTHATDHEKSGDRMDIDIDEVKENNADEDSMHVPSDDDLDSMHLSDTSRETGKIKNFSDTACNRNKEIAPKPAEQIRMNRTDANYSVEYDSGKEGDMNVPGSRLSSSPARNDGKGGTAAENARPNKANNNKRASNARRECEVCHEGRGGRRAMICTMCKCMYHSSCYRKNVSKMVHMTPDKQWYCPECDPELTRRAGHESANEIVKGLNIAAKSSRRADNLPAAATTTKSHNKDAGSSERANTNTSNNGDHTTAISQLEDQIKWVNEVAYHGGKKVNWMILEQTNDMLGVLKPMIRSLNEKIRLYTDGRSESVNSPKSVRLPHENPVSGLIEPDNDKETAESTWSWLKWMEEEMMVLKDMTQQLQVAGIQFEIDMIREIQKTPAHDGKGLSAFSFGAHNSGSRKNNNVGGGPGSQFRGASGTGGGAGGGSKVKNGASRLYSSKQIQKLEEWYQKSSRPEASEIQAMYRIINSAEYADRELQPDGISVKQIRIWFDNRRAKERLDYMRLKMKDVSTVDMDAESVKKMKAAYIDEAKEVLEARVSRLRENSNSATQIVDEADTILVASGEKPLSAKSTRPPSSTASKPAITQPHITSNASMKISMSQPKHLTFQKKRIRMESVASVRKAVKDAREIGKSEDEIKAIRAAAIDAAKDRLHIPTANARLGPTHPLGKSEVTHIKFKMLKLLEGGAPAENVTDMIEFLSCAVITREVLIESGLTGQIELASKAYQENKELVKQAKKLLDEFERIIERGDEADGNSKKAGENLMLSSSDGTFDAANNGSSSVNNPQSPTACSDNSKRVRSGKFSIAQLIKLEKYFKKDDTPSKKKLEKLSAKLSAMATEDGGKTLDYKQLRGWFYKRRSSNQPPHALLVAGSKLQEGGNSSGVHLEISSSTSSSDSETESDSNDSHMSSADCQSITGSSKTTPKRKAPDHGLNQAKRMRKVTPDGKESKTARGNKAFNVKQLSTLIELYERNRNPSSSRLDELVKTLNQEDHSDKHEGAFISRQQVQGWFTQRRAKEKKDLMRLQSKNAGSSMQTDASKNEVEDVKRTSTSACKELFGSTAKTQSAVNETQQNRLNASSSNEESDDDMDSEDQVEDMDTEE